VLIVAARKEKIEDRVAVAEGAGLEVAVMDVENYATEAAYSLVAKQLPDMGQQQTVMGRLFQRKTSQNDRTELLIFVTPKIMDDSLTLR